MENNIDQKIKKHFDNRALKPSYNAWNAMSTKLDLEAKKEANNKFRFLWYAAILVGLLFAVGYFLPTNQQPAKINTEPIIVNTEKTKSENNTFEKNNFENQPTEIVVKNDETTPLKKKQHVQKHFQKKTQVAQINKAIVTKNIKKNIQNNSEKIQVQTQQLAQVQTAIIKPFTKQQASTIAANSATVTTKKQEIKKNKRKLQTSDSQIDDLLAMAMNTNKKERTYSIEVNQNNLQNKVEDNLNKSNILRVLKAGVDTVEALVTNNN